MKPVTTTGFYIFFVHESSYFLILIGEIRKYVNIQIESPNAQEV